MSGKKDREDDINTLEREFIETIGKDFVVKDVAVKKGAEKTEKTKISRRYCKKCGKEVMAVKDQKIPGKQVANFFAFFLGSVAYTYPKRCPYCGKATRAIKSHRIAALIILIIWVIVIIITLPLSLGTL